MGHDRLATRRHAASWIVEQIGIENPTVEKVAGFAIGTVLAAIIASLFCMFHVGMPVWPSIFVCFSYNILAVILTILGYVLLAAIFAGWLVTSSEKIPLEPPGSFAPDESESDDLSGSLDLARALLVRNGRSPASGEPRAAESCTPAVSLEPTIRPLSLGPRESDARIHDCQLALSG